MAPLTSAIVAGEATYSKQYHGTCHFAKLPAWKPTVGSTLVVNLEQKPDNENVNYHHLSELNEHPDEDIVDNYKGFGLGSGLGEFSGFDYPARIWGDEEEHTVAAGGDGGGLGKKWHMIQHPARAWKPSRIRNALYACVILHNMIIEDNGRAICEFYEEDDPNLLEHVEINEEEKQANRRMLRNEDTHANLKADLIEHLWKNRFY
ncbi:hypothetical protein E3N88_31234 [Mikania micrantha]|uniref:Uncharacterized protein n=1 Tax=Mikania micrantha TaxID=192012 RepID=A0A5N6MP21_9ASTR|nr:hypothetical protein E3N88_31234 [Mikania micrantha]